MTQLANLYSQARIYLEQYLDSLNLPEAGAEIIEMEFEPYRNGDKKPDSIDGVGGVYYKMLTSLINKQGSSNYIGFDSVLTMADILFNYNPVKVYQAYGDDFDGLFAKLQERFPNKNLDITNRKNAWVQFAKGLISAAKFLSSFESYKKFDEFVESFSFNDYSVAALPMILEKEIYGYGFPLSCDFLKESGYTSYGKPDVHLFHIFKGVGVMQESSKEIEEIEAFRVIVKMAREARELPVLVDRLFWMIGSGKFLEYNKAHEDKIPVNRQKDNFVEIYNSKKEQNEISA